MSEPWSTPIGDVVVSAAGVGKSFPGGIEALRDVAFSVKRGELVALIGANGSGKTSLLKVLAGQLRADSGYVSVLEENPFLRSEFLRLRLGWVSQEPALDPEMTGREHLALFHTLYALPRKEQRARIEALALAFGLQEHIGRRVSTYSGGLRQRLHLALGLIHNPALILLDEATAALDPEGKSAAWERFAILAEQGQSLVIATHDLSEASLHCHRVGLMKGGQLKVLLPPQKLIAEYGSTVLYASFGRATGPVADFAGRLEACKGVGRVRCSSQHATVCLDRERGPEDEVFQVFREAGMNITSYQYRKPDLASAYFNLTGASLEDGRGAKEAREKRSR